MSRIIIKSLPDGIKVERLQKIFGKIGTITDCALKFTKDGVFRKFAFIGFKTEKEAVDAVKHFDKSFIDTTKIQVALASNLGDSAKHQPWSKHSLEKKKSLKTDVVSEKKEEHESEKKEKAKTHKTKFDNELLKEAEQDPKFQEFLGAHLAKSKKTTWSNDAILPGTKPDEISDVGLSTKKSDKYSGVESDKTVKKKEKKEKISDIDFLKSLRESGLDDDSDSDANCGPETDREEEEDVDKSSPMKTEGLANKTSQVKYLVKMRGLMASVKQAQIKEFFKPIIPVRIHVPQNASTRKTAYIATIEFSSAKDQDMALRRNKNKIGSKKIFLHKTNDIIKNSNIEDVTKRTWEIKKHDGDDSGIAESGRLYVRNLAYCCLEEDLEALFSKYGTVEVHLPIDSFTKKVKGFAFVSFKQPENAVTAFNELDGVVFQGRLLHILPGKVKQEDVKITDDMPFSKKKEILKKATASSTHNWNTLFLGTNAVVDTIAAKYGKSKTEVLQLTDEKLSKEKRKSQLSAGVQVALGETQIVAETRQFLIDNGVALDSFSQAAGARSKTVILVKHLPAGTTSDELRDVFQKHGTIGRLVLPPNGLTAIIEYMEPVEARTAFRNLAYTKFQHIPLYLEWAPVDVFESTAIKSESNDNAKKEDNETPLKAVVESKSASEDVEDEETEPGCTLFIKNLNFTTIEDSIRETFNGCGEVRSVSVARKKDPKHPGATLSMGYGFIEFKKAASAKEALKKLQHCQLDGHQIELKMSNRDTLKPKLSREKQDTKQKQKSTKILIRNIPFEAKLAELRQLFGAFGELKSVRIPKKVSGTGTHRGFGFVDFLTKEDAKRAFNALCHSTHLYGRRLVLEWADTEETVEQLRKKTADHYTDGPQKKRSKSSLLEELGSGEEDG